MQQQAPQAAPIAAPPAPPPPQKPRDASQFIRQPGQQAPAPTIQDLRRERHETREGNATVIREGDRTIVREGQRTIIRHSESDRFAVGARDVRVERRGSDTYSIIERPNGDRIITITDEGGHLLRRVRREPNGREIVIIDETRIPRRDNIFVVVPPRYRLAPDRYYVDIDRAPPERIYDTLIAAPFEPIEDIYSIDQVRYSPDLRMLMPRVDLDINFETGSWQIAPDQMGKLDVIARALSRAIDRNPREVFLIEGHTDAVGTAEDNLSLSDRRAESVAVALTQEFGVPPENLITQGYGEQELKVPTMGPSRENRRVAVRRITPLIDRTAGR
jgi:outer membrane protein OmpA-like peptidoglycan-associated protein